MFDFLLRIKLHQGESCGPIKPSFPQREKLCCLSKGRVTGSVGNSGRPTEESGRVSG